MNEKHCIYIIGEESDLLCTIQHALTAEGFAVETYGSPEAFLERVIATALGCVVMDISVSGVTGLQLLIELRERGSLTPAIIVSRFGDIPRAVLAMKLGAADFLERPFSPDALICSIRCALSLTGDAKSGNFPTERRGRLSALSQRENCVLDGLVKGLSNKTIAEKLGISSRTVEVHRSNVMKKTKAKSLAELVRIAMSAQLN
ncbi:MAG TPA: LuxR C-terminal-related transcriptional regulator [Methylocystis sp.]|nr:LuxR C-terminal-related transcriptional regulator [Methylocystis sp.]